MRSLSSNGFMIPMNGSLVMMNLSLSDEIMQQLLTEIAIEESDEETL